MTLSPTTRLEVALEEGARAIADLIAAKINAQILHPPPRELASQSAGATELLSRCLRILEQVRDVKVMRQEPHDRAGGDRILRSAEVKRILGVSATTLWRMHREKILVPVRLWGGNKGYRESQITAFLASLLPAELDRSRIAAALASRKHGRRRPTTEADS